MNEFHAIAKALADPQRFEILEIVLAENGITCGEVADQCTVSQATVSHHLKILAGCGLISIERRGQCSLLSGNPAQLRRYSLELNKSAALAA